MSDLAHDRMVQGADGPAPEAGPDPEASAAVSGALMTPAKRAGLDALEREFKDLLQRA